MNEAQRTAMWKQIADGPAGWVIRMREKHGATFEADPHTGELIWTGCKCGMGHHCPSAAIWLAHIDDLKEANNQKQQQFQAETLRASKAESERDQAQSLLHASEARERELRAELEDVKNRIESVCINARQATSERDAALAQVAGLREALEKVIKAVCTRGHDFEVFSPEQGAPYFRESSLREGLDAILGEKEN